MKNRLFASLTVLLAVLFALPSLAQDSKVMLDKLSAKAKTFDNLYAEYTYTLEDTKNDINLSQDGKIWLRQNKFHVDLPEYTVISDGETIWTYEKENNVCTIDYLEDVKDGGMDPSELFTIWEKDFNHEWKATKKVGETEVEVIYLYPKDPSDKPFHTIYLYVDMDKKEIKQVVTKGKDGQDTTYSLNKFNPEAEFTPYKFVFNKAGYPGVEMQDNRL